MPASLMEARPTRPPARSLMDRVLGLRDRILLDPRFQAWASRFPLTRPIVRRRTRAVFDICAGFVYAQVLAACVKLRLFELLRDGPQSGAVLAERMGLRLDRAERLLAAAVSLQLVERRGAGRYGLGVLGAAVAGNPGIAAMVEHHDVLYADLRDPVALLRGESRPGLEGFWAYAKADQPSALGDANVATYSALMAASQSLVSAEILDAYPVGKHRCLMDIGGGDGSFLAAVAARAPGLSLMLFDLPPVAELARARFERMGLSGRARAVGGDFIRDALPTGADIISLVRVIHDHDDDHALAILRAARAALPAEGTLLLAEPMAGTRGAEPVGDAYFGFYLMAMGSGRARTPAELEAMLVASGFDQVTARRTGNPLLASVLTARPRAGWAAPPRDEA